MADGQSVVGQGGTGAALLVELVGEVSETAWVVRKYVVSPETGAEVKRAAKKALLLEQRSRRWSRSLQLVGSSLGVRCDA